MAEEQGNVGVGNGLMSSWLPNPQQARFRCGGLEHHRRNRSKNEILHQQQLQQQSKLNSRPVQPRQARQPGTWKTGGPGMQAFFLDSATKKSCGTGVFLPQIRTHNQVQPSKKPAYAPVLLPSRVVQALNLNVHELGVQITSQKGTDAKNMKKKAEQEMEKPTGDLGTFSEKESSSPLIFLPKEWTY